MIGFIQAGETNNSIYKASNKSKYFPKSGLMFWMSAEHIKLVDGVVTTLNDQSGNKNHAHHGTSEGVAMTNPVVFKDPNSGQAILNFNGENCCFSFNQITDVRTGFCDISKDPKAYGTFNEKCVLGGKYIACYDIDGLEIDKFSAKVANGSKVALFEKVKNLNIYNSLLLDKYLKNK